MKTFFIDYWKAIVLLILIHDSFNVYFKTTGEENLLPSIIPLRSDEDFLVRLLQIN